MAPSADEIMQVVCRAYGLDNAALRAMRRGKGNEPRKIAIYLVRTLRGEKLEDIGRQVNMNDYSSVSSVIERMKTELEGWKSEEAR